MEGFIWKDILLAFIPIFVAIDAIGTLPIFVSLTHGVTPEEKKEIIAHSMWTAVSLALVFILLGRMIFRLLGITMADFMIAGGAILFCIAIIDLLRPGKQRRISSQHIGVVPIGTPLVVGPAVLTTSLIVLDQYGPLATSCSVLINIFFAGVVFTNSERLIRFLGRSGALALSKIMALFLAAIAVMMIRKGIFQILQSYLSGGGS